MFKRKKSKTLLDEIKELVVMKYRKLAEINGTAPTAKTSDKEVIEIYQTVAVAFKNAAKKRGEELTGMHIHRIAYKFFQVYELMGPEMFDKHLKYELKNLYPPNMIKPKN